MRVGALINANRICQFRSSIDGSVFCPFHKSGESCNLIPDPRYFFAGSSVEQKHRAAACGVYLMLATLTNNLIITGLPTATTTTAPSNGLPNRYLCMKTCQAVQVFRTHSRGNCTPPCTAPLSATLHTVLLSADNDIHWFLCPGFSQFMRAFPLALPLYVSLFPSPILLWFSPDFF